jgi:hypothetical protein
MAVAAIVQSSVDKKVNYNPTLSDSKRTLTNFAAIIPTLFE